LPPSISSDRKSRLSLVDEDPVRIRLRLVDLPEPERLRRPIPVPEERPHADPVGATTPSVRKGDGLNPLNVR